MIMRALRAVLAVTVLLSAGCPCEQPPETPSTNDRTANEVEAPPEVPFEPPPPPGAQLSLSQTHGCLRTGHGDVRCWGDNGWGQLGPGDGAPGVVEVGGGVAEVGAGYGFTCLRDEESVRCLGANIHGQTGQPVSDEVRTPAAVPGLSAVVALSLAQNHACALLRDGTVRCWGENRYGQLGTGGTEPSLGPTAVPGINSVVQIDAGAATCAVRADGSVWCWGTNLSERPAPLSVSDVVQVDMGGIGDGCARRRDGSLYCWGFNESGQLGGDATDEWLDPRPIAGLTDVSDVAVGTNFMCALSNGRVLCLGAEWGVGELPDDCRIMTQNSSGGGSAAQWHYCNRPVPLDLEGVVDIEAGGRNACALLADARVYCWGLWEPEATPTGYLPLPERSAE